MIRVPRVAGILVVGALLGAAGVIGVARPEAQSAEAERIREATIVLQEIMNAPDSAVPKSIAGRAEGVAVFPNLIKGGFVFGGQWGRGVISARIADKGTWSSPGFVTIAGGSFGAQIGGQAVDLVLIIMDRRGLSQLLRNQFKVGVDASAAAGPVGRSAEAATDILLRAQILSYSRTRGLFVGASVNGSTVKEDRNANGRFYGQRFRTSEILLEGRGGAPESVPAWRDALIKYF